MIYILIGEMGVGKNYVGEKLAAKLNCEFIDGDDALLPNTRAKVEAFKPLTKKDLEEFMENLAFTIAFWYDGTNTVVAQAIYRNENRAWLKQKLEDCGFEVKFVWIKAPFITHLKRIWNNRGYKWLLYWLMNKPFFQKPDKNIYTINNITEPCTDLFLKGLLDDD